jgi:hypothetical protein
VRKSYENPKSELGKELIEKLDLIVLRTTSMDESMVSMYNRIWGHTLNEEQIEYEKRISELEGTVKTLKQILKGFLK